MRKFGKFLKMFEKVLVLEKNNDTKIKPWFRFPIPKPGFGRTLAYCSNIYTVPGIDFDPSISSIETITEAHQ